MDSSERRQKALDVLGVTSERKRNKRRTRPVSTVIIHANEEHPGRYRYLSCTRKVRYPNQSAATKEARHIESVRGTRIRVYFCSFCSGYHLTKHMKGNRK